MTFKFHQPISPGEAVREVRGWLDIKMRTGHYSFGLAVELAHHLIGRVYDVHNIYDEIGILEGGDIRPSSTKAAEQFKRPPLLGLWHKHHFQARFIPKNLRLEMMKEAAIETMLARCHGRNLDELAGQVAHEVVMGGFTRRAGEHRLTGEFIVYEHRADGSNYYLTLGAHGEYDEIRKRVDAYRQTDREQGHCFSF
jgi:hypothetical protein